MTIIAIAKPHEITVLSYDTRAMDIEEFYKRVKSLVKIRKTTIEYVVGKAGLTLGSYNAYRRNKNLPRADEAFLIAQVLDTSIEYLVAGDTPKLVTADDTIEEIKTLINRYQKTRKKG